VVIGSVRFAVARSDDMYLHELPAIIQGTVPSSIVSEDMVKSIAEWLKQQRKDGSK
jgi:hypothetical protein